MEQRVLRLLRVRHVEHTLEGQLRGAGDALERAVLEGEGGDLLAVVLDVRDAVAGHHPSLATHGVGDLELHRELRVGLLALELVERAEGQVAQVETRGALVNRGAHRRHSLKR